VGFSGSFPDDAYETLRLDDLMGPALLQVRNAALVERGVSAKPTVELHPFDVTAQLRGVKWPKTRWGYPTATRPHTYEQAIIRHPARHAFIQTLLRPDALTVIIVNHIAHGKLLAQALPSAVFLSGAADSERRAQVIEQWRQKPGGVLVVTKILDRGTNRLGHATDLIFASGEGSSAQTLQRLGRGLRRADGKAFLRLVDVVDRVMLAPDEEGPLAMAAEFLHKAGRQRIRLYEVEGFDVEVVT
jgi:superfamily II DNA or RNA helicase